jgi:hypothetical protein
VVQDGPAATDRPLRELNRATADRSVRALKEKTGRAVRRPIPEPRSDQPSSQPRRPGRRVGRRPKSTAQVITTVADKIREGASFETACVLAGVSRASGQAWQATARRLAESPGDDSGPVVDAQDQEWPNIPRQLFLDFLDAIEKARAEDEHRRIGRITEAAEGGSVASERIEERILKDGTRLVTTERKYRPPDWCADAWMLERRDPDRWGRKVRFEPPAPPVAPPAEPPDLLDVLTQVWADKDPRRRPRSDGESEQSSTS